MATSLPFRHDPSPTTTGGEAARIAALEARIALLEEHLAAAHREVDHLRHVDTWKTAFMAAAGHDLRAPLAVIAAGAQTLVAHADLGPTRGIAERIGARARELDGMLSDLLDLDRYTRGRVRPQRQPTDMTELVDQVLSDVHLGTEDLVVTRVEPLVADVDPARTAQILGNLLRNARSHTPDGTRVQLAVSADADGIVIAVDDDGPGVPPELRDRLFEPFVSHVVDGDDSTGLGLSLVRMFAELQGGTAEVTDRPGGGARFVVRLPATTRRRVATGPDLSASA